MKLSMSRPSKILKCITRALQQVKNTPKYFSLACRCFTVIGPNKSIPLYQRRGIIASTLFGCRSLVFDSLYIFFFSSKSETFPRWLREQTLLLSARW